MVAISNFFCRVQKRVVRAYFLFCFYNRIVSQLGVGFHDVEFLCRQFARLEQNGIRNPYFSDVMQWRGFEHHIDKVRCHDIWVFTAKIKLVGKDFDVVLSADNVVAGFLIAGFCQTCQRVNGDILDDAQLFEPALYFPLPETHSDRGGNLWSFVFEVNTDSRHGDRWLRGFLM